MRKANFISSLILVLLLSTGFGFAQTKVTGVVTSNEDNLPLIGATVFVEGTTRGQTTDLDGKYSIAVSAGETLVFSFVGFTDQSVVVAANQTQLDVVMKNDGEQIDDVVVVAYGVRRKGTVAGSVGSVGEESIQNIPTPSFDQALQGQVTGLTVTSNSGDPSKATDFAIRGTNSINSGTQPLFILDGTPISSSDFNTINPNDIGSVTVLKDASSTSIYGARAANGVIIITSKRGKHGDRPNISLRSQFGVSQIAHGNWDIMNTAQRIQYEKEIGLEEGKSYDILSQTDVCWLNEVFRNNAPLQSYDLSVSGASDKFNYFLSGNLYDQTGVAIDTHFKRAGMRANFDVNAAEWLKIGSNTMFTYENFAEAIEGEYTIVTPISAARFMLPYYTPYRPDGSIASTNDGSWLGTGENPLEWSANNPVDRNQYKLLLQPFVEITPIEGLKFRSQFGYDYTQMESFIQSFPSYLPNNGIGNASRSMANWQTLSITNTLTYNFDIENIHRFTMLLGQEGVDASSRSFAAGSRGQKNDILTNLSSGTSATTWQDGATGSAYLSYFGRAEYSFNNKLFVDASLRGDASSKFGADNRWALFWSLGGMYDFRESDFVTSSDALSSFQIALSVGTSGNSSIANNYEPLALVGGGYDYVGDGAMAPISRANPDLSWEQLFTTNLSFRVGLWDRLDLNLEFYDKRTSNMLMSVPVAPSANQGFMFEWQNVGGMLNRGAELSASGMLVATKDFNWSVSANISYNYNETTELYAGVNEYEMSETYTKLVVGKSVGSYYINRFAGVNPINGDALWYDIDGELTNEMKVEDRVMLDKNYNAPWQGGFGTNLSWKGLSLNAQFSWVADRWVMNNDRFFDESNGRFVSYNQSSALLDRWKEPGDIADIPRHGVFTEFDSRLLEDASFLRLKNLSLTWALPATWLGKTHFIKGAKIYAQGQNLLTFTNFTGLDPEGSTNLYAASYPMTRQYTFGVDLNF